MYENRSVLFHISPAARRNTEPYIRFWGCLAVNGVNSKQNSKYKILRVTFRSVVNCDSGGGSDMVWYGIRGRGPYERRWKWVWHNAKSVTKKKKVVSSPKT